MKNRFLLTSLFLFLIFFSFHIQATAHSRNRQPPPPLWFNSHFQNIQRESLSYNGVLANSITQFNERYILTNLNATNRGINSDGSFSDELNARFRETLVHGFMQDNFSQIMPFNVAFVDRVLSDVYFYFSRPYHMEGFAGHYLNRWWYSNIWLSTNVSRSWGIVQNNLSWVPNGQYRAVWNGLPSNLIAPDYISIHDNSFSLSFAFSNPPVWGDNKMLSLSLYDRFGNHVMDWTQITNTSQGRGSFVFGFEFIALHELGHALGLGESLADLFAETYLGANGSIRNTANLEYNSTFDRLLLERTGEIVFWHTAFKSNDAYARLWNEHFSHLINHRELEMVKGVVRSYYFGHLDNNSVCNFHLYSGHPLTIASSQILSDFVFLATTEQSHQNWATIYNHFRDWVTVFVDFSRIHSLETTPSVLDHVITSHNGRHLQVKPDFFGW